MCGTSARIDSNGHKHTGAAAATASRTQSLKVPPSRTSPPSNQSQQTQSQQSQQSSQQQQQQQTANINITSNSSIGTVNSVK